MTTALVPVLVAPRAIERTDAASVQAFLAELASERTRSEYGRILARFWTFAGSLRYATPAHVHTFCYAAGESGRQPSPSTVSVRLAALRAFFDFALRMRLVGVSPAVSVRRPELNRPLPRGLSAQELRRLLDAIPLTEAGRRDRVIILLMVLTGLRRSEAMNLRRQDLERDETGRTFATVKVKGGRIRRRELPGPLALMMHEVGAVAADTLWEVSAGGFAANLRRYARKAKLTGVSPHTLRHSASQLRRASGASIEDIQALLGHASIATTARYLMRLEPEADTGWQGAAALLGLDWQ